MDQVDEHGHEQVIVSTRAFIEALKATGAVRRFAEATRRFESDPEVQSLMQTLQQFQQAQRTGEVLPVALEVVRNAQERFRKHPVVREFLASRDAVGSLLQETNVEISQVLGIDFGQTAGPAGGSC